MGVPRVRGNCVRPRGDDVRRSDGRLTPTLGDAGNGVPHAVGTTTEKGPRGCGFACWDRRRVEGSRSGTAPARAAGRSVRAPGPGGPAHSRRSRGAPTG